ncbi:DUF262 domain-containing protein [Aquimarina sp. I32.4]|uniref:DUF262 domain-containing protein n=1 Tax=Aquimarina sp. I32.4 TaxID=2053903 RepID=UPI000CDEEA3A|nr:DUF262 domain-containing protein [Aquimarina sp. I32.4]
MKAEEKDISSIFADNHIYEIPKYQRPYSWTEDNVSELISDVADAFENDLIEYFIGSIITIEKSKKQYEVVDGQQRLTTLTLIFAGLRNLISDETAKAEIQKKILPINAFTEEPEQPRLKVRNKEHLFFYEHILLGKKIDTEYSLGEIEQKFLNNLKTVEKFFRDKNETYLKKYANYLLQSVYVVFVNTDSFESAYRLFNVLNARGLSLSNGDLLKNQLFGLSKTELEQNKIEQYWNQLEDIITIKHLDSFLSHYRTALKANKAQKDLYQEYVDYLKDNQISAEDFCKTLVNSAKNYKKLRTLEFSDNRTKKFVQSLFNVSYDEWIPPVLAYMNKPIENMPFDDFIGLIEKITYQNWVRRLGRTKRNTVYYNVINKLKGGAREEEITELIYSYTNNEEFFSLLNSNVYGMSYAKAVLLRMDTASQDDSVLKNYSGLISIEHILPQTGTDEYWKSRFNEEQVENNVHKLGNLVLLSGRKNSQAQNHSFGRKREIYQRKNEATSFDLTKKVCDTEEWTLSEIEKRQSELLKLAKKIWEIKTYTNVV